MTARPPLDDEAIEQKETFSPEEFAALDPEKIPQHIAIIMDGNRRWAKNNGLPPMVGHWEGTEGLTDIVRAAADLGVKTLTVFGFSTENWARSESEIEALMNILELYLIQKKEMMLQEGICLHAIGDLTRLPERVQAAFLETKKATEGCQRINLILALNYGGRDEIRRAIGRILARNERQKVLPEELTEEFISQYLDTNRWEDPDLLIRTSGELRVSNFLLWQISYTELYITNVLWPDFTPKELYYAVLAYQSRHRRIGSS